MNLRRLLLIAAIATVHLPLLAAELNVFAAASLSDALKELSPQFQAATGHTIRFNLGASGALARQIKEGAPCDVFFSADELRVDQLAEAGLLQNDTRRTLLMNQLVLVVSAEATNVARIDDLQADTVRRIAIGEPATVPAGTYAKAYLEKINLWSSLAPKMVPLDNVRSVLAAVDAGNADAGFVYKTDAMISKHVRVAEEVPLADGPRITYPAAVTKESKQPEAARALVQWFAEGDAQAVFARFGFVSATAR